MLSRTPASGPVRRFAIPRRVVLPIVLVLLCAVGCEREAEPARAPAPSVPLTYVGAAACAACHDAQWDAWRGSHHDLAMQEASADTVLGDFDDAHLAHGGESSRFLRRGDAFLVETVGPDGARAEFEVAYAFGAAPLQQYLVRLDDGRLQPLTTAWDTRPAAEGGQRWFHLYPDETIPHDDPIHWTSRALGWNANCAPCHSTGLRKGYDAKKDRYQTTWHEVDVACEACHGPGSRHAAWAEAGAQGDDSGLSVDFATGSAGEWRFVEGRAIAERSQARESDAEIDTCAPCHALRTPLVAEAKPGRPFLDGHRPALLDEGRYFADGQIQDEVYVWGSFLQSRMHAAGVSCTDCHDPHSLAVADEPDATCAGCHQPAVFATPAHHHHEAESEGASCVSCHMPARTYMGVDDRRDHGFRVPRPALAARVGAPDACTSCHVGKEAAWAAAAAERWWGADDAEHPGDLLHAGRAREPGVGPALASLAADASVPAITRATAVRLLGGYSRRVAEPAIERALRDADPLLRMAAAGVAAALPDDARRRLLAPAWRDARRAVRVEAAQAAGEIDTSRLAPSDQAAHRRALAEYRDAQRATADTPAARVNLASLAVQREAWAEARDHYEAALALAPWFVPAYVNLADLERAQGDDAAALARLEAARALAPEDADVRHAIGLAQVRLGRRSEALESLAFAARAQPRNAHYAYVHAIGLHSAGRTAEAIDALRQARERHPDDPELLLGLAMLSRDAGERDAARAYAEELLERVPGDPMAQGLLRELGASESREP